MNQKGKYEKIDQPDLKVEAVIEAYVRSERAPIRALLIANEYVSAEVARPHASQSVGYARGRNAAR